MALADSGRAIGAVTRLLQDHLLRRGFQVSIGKGLSEVFARIETWTDPVPEPVLGLAVLALAAVFVIATLRDRHRPDASTDADPDEHPACHGPGVGAHPDNHS